jgi:serine/threonine protein kinase
MFSRSNIYCVTEPYRGTRLKAYLQNETLTKSQFRSLVSQIVMALGQVHECNVVYNGISTDGICMLDEGYIMLNDFSKSCEVNAEEGEIGIVLQEIQPP